MKHALTLAALAVALASSGLHAQTGGATLTPSGQPLPSSQAYLPDLAFGAYQRGYYVTALREAMNRVQANDKDAPAMTLIGELYSQGLTVRRDPAEAAHWYKLASERGDRQATFQLAVAAMEGNGIAKDRDYAKQLFEKAAAQGHPGALYNLGIMAIENNGVVPDFPKAADLFRRSALAGDPDAAYSLGILYKQGKGVSQDNAQAAEWLKRAADNNNTPGMVEYAIMLFNGEGIERDETAGARLMLKAAARNNAVAQNRVARILAAGRGLPKDMVEAMKWHLLARTSGLKDAWLDSQLAALSPEEKQGVEEAVRRYVANQ
ncbi:MAG: tetratricopeptide repeat protein [Beijerinckiaceae bacterium]